ncbi:hypothetical protein TBLA_0D03570 [Henningerozyma blattae CBS 6284]|uniref:Uncharacterized protein n=1 Tax=Henningerozyma blattae (strain ATCC 34711 / CBS 6284 / DSM 70876 / NBRC 10599 / NRRL Y-10934 / UCD 77-7) TaxID=1071380 RepID=I2H3A5_HENB6|nr:hypothetical protein TBLA_0D03570 [Tetrapisispora blattae CBS 6284]CCH60857.1 hypothetical protein TBLA_0D03570 [Tetrapisispora blattae CBS 6284]
MSDATRHVTVSMVYNYRRRDLRNGLASRLGIRDKSVPEKRLRISKIGLDVSDYEIEDLLKSMGHEIKYSKTFDTKEERVVVVEFKDESVLREVVEKYQGYELNGGKVFVEVFERRPARGRPVARPPRRGGRGGKSFRSGRRSPERSAEQLDSELEQYLQGK